RVGLAGPRWGATVLPRLEHGAGVAIPEGPVRQQRGDGPAVAEVPPELGVGERLDEAPQPCPLAIVALGEGAIHPAPPHPPETGNRAAILLLAASAVEWRPPAQCRACPASPPRGEGISGALCDGRRPGRPGRGRYRAAGGGRPPPPTRRPVAPAASGPPRGPGRGPPRGRRRRRRRRARSVPVRAACRGRHSRPGRTGRADRGRRSAVGPG